jgi:hypothetical protein
VEHKVKNNQGPNPPRGASVEHPNPLPVQAISLPAAIPAYYESEQGERPSRNARERIKIAIEFGAFASAVVLSVLTLYTLRATREATQVANRAYLACGAPEIFGPGIKILPITLPILTPHDKEEMEAALQAIAIFGNVKFDAGFGVVDTMFVNVSNLGGQWSNRDEGFSIDFRKAK